MDRRNYDKTTLIVFDTTGAFFVDAFYNNHYLRAREQVKTGRCGAITDAYRDAILNYMNGIKKRQDLYQRVVHSLHEYYQKSLGVGSILFSEFEDKFLAQFIPPEYYKDFSNANKDTVLREIIVTTVARFGHFVLSKSMLSLIIDDHMNRANVNTLMDKIIDLFLIQREEYYTKFANEVVRKTGGGQVELGVFNMLKEEYVREKRAACKLAADHERALNMISALTKHVQDLQAEIVRLKENRVRYPATPYPSPQRARPEFLPTVEEIPTPVPLETPELPPEPAVPAPTDRQEDQRPPSPPIQASDESAESSDEETLHQRQRNALLESMRRSRDTIDKSADIWL